MTERRESMTVILEHFQHPRNYGLIPLPDVDREEVNPSCGDRIRMQARVDAAGVIEEVRFVGNGCAISMAAASLLTTRSTGLTLKDVVRLPELTMIDALEGTFSPRRFDCALLAFRALRGGLIAFYHDRRLRDKGF